MSDKLLDLMFNWKVWVVLIILGILVDFLIAKYIYHDIGCMVSECRKLKP